MSEGKSEKNIQLKPDCVDQAKKALEKEPNNQVWWSLTDGHAYIIPPNSTPDTQIPFMAETMKIKDRIFKIQPYTLDQLEWQKEKGEVIDITNFIKKHV